MIVVSRRGKRGEIEILFISKATLKTALTEHLFLKIESRRLHCI